MSSLPASAGPARVIASESRIASRPAADDRAAEPVEGLEGGRPAGAVGHDADVALELAQRLLGLDAEQAVDPAAVEAHVHQPLSAVRRRRRRPSAGPARRTGSGRRAASGPRRARGTSAARPARRPRCRAAAGTRGRRGRSPRRTAHRLGSSSSAPSPSVSRPSRVSFARISATAGTGVAAAVAASRRCSRGPRDRTSDIVRGRSCSVRRAWSGRDAEAYPDSDEGLEVAQQHRLGLGADDASSRPGRPGTRSWSGST